MPQFLQKSLLKWSAIAVLGVSAYFVGYFWGYRTQEVQEMTAKTEAPALPKSSQKTGQFSELKERIH